MLLRDLPSTQRVYPLPFDFAQNQAGFRLERSSGRHPQMCRARATLGDVEEEHWISSKGPLRSIRHTS